MPNPQNHPAVDFPPGNYFALTTGLSFNYGGQTKAMFSRSRAIAEFGCIDVTVVTFDFRDDYEQLETELLRRGELTDRLHLLNVWAGLSMLRPASEYPPEAVFTPLNIDHIDTSSVGAGGVIKRCRLDARGCVLQSDFIRSDGTLLVSARYDCRNRGLHGGTSIVLCDRKGRPVQAFDRMYELFFFWFDALIEDDDAYAIVDSKAIAREFATQYWNRDRLILIHQVHNAHLSSELEAPIGHLRRKRMAALENADVFDAVALLTERQRHDVFALLGRTDEFIVMPNTVASSAETEHENDRDPSAGVAVARLIPSKNVSHSIRATARRSETGSSAKLAIYGEGPRRKPLEKLVRELGITHSIAFEGYSTDVPSVFAKSSYLLMTGSAEGFPMVIVESMACGCIPIAYDVAYGPSDIITHGTDGFLVPPGDVNGLTEAIRRIQEMPPDRLRQMRGAARRRAMDFSASVVAGRWAEVMRTLRTAKDNKPSADFTMTIGRVTQIAARRRITALNMTLRLVPSAEIRADQLVATCMLRSRRSTFRMRIPADQQIRKESGLIDLRFDLPIGKLALMDHKIVDVSLRIWHGTAIHERRLPFPEKSFGARLTKRFDESSRLLFKTRRGNLSIRTR